MVNTSSTTNKILIAIFLLLAVVCIYSFLSGTNSNLAGDKFKNVGPFQQYWLDPYAYNPYFAKDIYMVPGSGNARLAHNVNTKEYDNSYLPYESAIPAVDVLRANASSNNSSKILPPSYYTQVIRHNTTPYSVPVVKTLAQ